MLYIYQYFTPFYGQKYSIVWIYHILLIHLSVNGHLHYIHFLAIMTSAAMNICVQVFM